MGITPAITAIATPNTTVFLLPINRVKKLDNKINSRIPKLVTDINNSIDACDWFGKSFIIIGTVTCTAAAAFVNVAIDNNDALNSQPCLSMM